MRLTATRPQAVPGIIATPTARLACDVRTLLARATGRHAASWLGCARNLVANHPAVRALLTVAEVEVIDA